MPVIVGVISVVRSGSEDRIEIQRRDPEVLQVVQPFQNPQQVATLIPVLVWRCPPWLEPQAGRMCESRAPGKPVRKDLIEHSILNPFRCCDCQAAFFRKRGGSHRPRYLTHMVTCGANLSLTVSATAWFIREALTLMGLQHQPRVSGGPSE